jgi:hypothetical protein
MADVYTLPGVVIAAYVERALYIDADGIGRFTEDDSPN